MTERMDADAVDAETRVRRKSFAEMCRETYAMSDEDAFTVNDVRIDPCPTTGCWLWIRNTTSSGYARVNKRDRTGTAFAHRLTWEKVNGPIPVGMVVDHICRTRSCVNPDHLRIVSVRDNSTLNSVGPTALRRAQTCCSVCGGQYTSFGSRGRRCVDCDWGHRLRRMRKQYPHVTRYYDPEWQKQKRAQFVAAFYKTAARYQAATPTTRDPQPARMPGTL